VVAEGFAQDRVGANVRYAFSSVPRLEAQALPGQPLLLASLVIGRVGPDSARQAAASVYSAALDAARGELRLRFADGSLALLRTPEAAGQAAELGGRIVEKGALAALLSKGGALTTLRRIEN
jgi:hypothetical protein